MSTKLDLVCGAQVAEELAIAESEYLGTQYYFCSLGCKHKFDQRPEDYVPRSGHVSVDESIV